MDTESLIMNKDKSKPLLPIVDSIDFISSSISTKNQNVYTKDVLRKMTLEIVEFAKNTNIIFSPPINNAGSSAIIGHSAIPAGAMNPGIIYAPYIPLITSSSQTTYYDINTHTEYDLPVWVGGCRPFVAGGFHEIIRAIYKQSKNGVQFLHPDDTHSFFNVKRAFEKFSVDNHKKEVIISLSNGIDAKGTDDVVFVKCIFGGIDFINAAGIDDTEWTTPVRIKLALPNSQSVIRKHRLTYGGHFYATGYADISDTVHLNERLVKDENNNTASTYEVTLFESGVDKATVSNMEIKDLFWVDYKIQGNTDGVKIL